MDLAGAKRATKITTHQDGALPDVQRQAIAGEDVLRAQLYNLLSQFLWSAPSQQHLEIVASLQADGPGEMAAALARFADEAATADVEAERDAYEVLFIGLGRGKLVPYGSYYLTGFLNEKPLAQLRQSLDAMGIERDEGRTEPEDHAASVMEVMSGLIDRRYGRDFPVAEQKRFFDAHVFSWMPHFFKDLEMEGETSSLYAALGGVGAAFLALENDGFDMLQSA